MFGNDASTEEQSETEGTDVANDKLRHKHAMVQFSGPPVLGWRSYWMESWVPDVRFAATTM